MKNSEVLTNSLDNKKLLYVGQREYATVKFDDKFIDFIGTNDATTCHIVLIVDQSNRFISHEVVIRFIINFKWQAIVHYVTLMVHL